MECLRNCWFQNPDEDFDIEYASDSSVGLAASDNESPPNESYDDDSDRFTTKTYHDDICNQCVIHQTTIIEVRTLLMEQKRYDLITIKQLKNKYNKLLVKYNEKKELLKQFALSHINETEKIENIMDRMETLSNDNSQILKEKHNIEREYEELKNKNLSLQLEINNHNQIMHQLNIVHNREIDELKEEYRNHSTKLLKELNDLKQENVSFLHYKTNNNNVWAHFDDNKHIITRSRSRSAPEHSDHSDAASDSYEDNNNYNNNDAVKLIQTQSISKSVKNNELPSIDEQKEDLTLNKLIRNRSISSDGTYDYEDNIYDNINELSNNDNDNNNNNEPQFIIMRSPSQQSLYNEMQQQSYESYNEKYGYNGYNSKQVSFSRNSGLDTPVSPLTNTFFTGDSFFGNTDVNNNREKLVKFASNPIYIDDDGIDVTDDNNSDSKDRNDNNEYEYDDIKVNMNVHSKQLIDLQTTQTINHKLQIVSSENTSLKSKNEKLREEINELMRQLEMKNQ